MINIAIDNLYSAVLGGIGCFDSDVSIEIDQYRNRQPFRSFTRGDSIEIDQYRNQGTEKREATTAYSSSFSLGSVGDSGGLGFPTSLTMLIPWATTSGDLDSRCAI